jgi:hypothetical protein
LGSGRIKEKELATTLIKRKRSVVPNLLKFLIPLFFLILLTTIIAYSYYSSQSIEPERLLQTPSAPQIPTKSQPIQSIPAFKTPPYDVNKVIIRGETPEYISVFLTPNVSVQPNIEYGIQINYRDNGSLRSQIKAVWNSGDIQNKKQLSIPIKATQAEITQYPLVSAFWDGVNRSVQSYDFSIAFVYPLKTIDGLTEQQAIAKQNQEQQDRYQQLVSQYQQQLVIVEQQKQDIKNQQLVLHTQYLQRLSEKEDKSNKILFIFIPIDLIILAVILILIYVNIKTNPVEIEEQLVTDDRGEKRGDYFQFQPTGATGQIKDQPPINPGVNPTKPTEDSMHSTEFNDDRIPIPKSIIDEIRKRSQNSCENPECKTKWPIHVHHIDMNRTNSNVPSNLVALCPKCHHHAHHHPIIPQSQLHNWVNANISKFKEQQDNSQKL